MPLRLYDEFGRLVTTDAVLKVLLQGVDKKLGSLNNGQDDVKQELQRILKATVEITER